jgi:uncharacterized protein YvpB
MNIDFGLYLIISSVILTVLLIINVLYLINTIRTYKITGSKFRIGFRHLINKVLWLNILLIIGIVYGCYSTYINQSPSISRTYPTLETIWSDYNKPIEITFNIPVKKDELEPNISVPIKGRWEWDSFLGIERLTKNGRFYPEETLMPNERIVIYITGISRLGFNESHEHGTVFLAPSQPEVIATSPLHKSKSIPTDSDFKILFNKDTDNVSNIEFKITPDIEFDIHKESPREFVLKPKKTLKQSTEYTLTIDSTPKRTNMKTGTTIDVGERSKIHTLSITTLREPFVKSITPSGDGVKVDSTVRVRFDSEMDHTSVEQNLSIVPNIEYETEWLDRRTLLIKPLKDLEKEKKHSILISKGVKTYEGGVTDKEISHEFETIGKIKIRSSSPRNGDQRLSTSVPISIEFNQEVDKKSAEEMFRINPNVNGSFSWDKNRLIFTPSALSFSTTYTVSVLPGIKSIYGISNTERFSFSFSTRSNEVVISMPIYFQPQPSFACNIYTAMMGLGWKGHGTSANQIIAEIGYDNRTDASGRWLGNPHENFIGNSTASWGYGAYATAIQKVFTSRNVVTEVRNNWNINDLARSIENGNPVIIWRYNGTSRPDTNISWGYGGVHAINGQHGGVVTGYRGTPENPTAFHINDPWFGLVWMDAGTFDYYWSRMMRMALIIY